MIGYIHLQNREKVVWCSDVDGPMTSVYCVCFRIALLSFTKDKLTWPAGLQQGRILEQKVLFPNIDSTFNYVSRDGLE